MHTCFALRIRHLHYCLVEVLRHHSSKSDRWSLHDTLLRTLWSSPPKARTQTLFHATTISNPVLIRPVKLQTARHKTLILDIRPSGLDLSTLGATPALASVRDNIRHCLRLLAAYPSTSTTIIAQRVLWRCDPCAYGFITGDELVRFDEHLVRYC